MGFLTETKDNTTIWIGNMKFIVFPAFDVVLDIQSLCKEDLPGTMKIQHALEMLVVNRWKLSFLDMRKKEELLREIYKKCIITNQNRRGHQQSSVFDFEYDGEYIYSSFMLDYGMDLFEMRGTLHWKKFIALFKGLSEKTKMREVMRIRTMEIPQYNGKNGKQIQDIQELKSYYGLQVSGGGGQEGLDGLFSALERMAVKDG